MDKAEDQVILTTFQARLLPRNFFFLITKSLYKIVAELLHKAQKYMNAENAVTTEGLMTKRKWDEGTSHNLDREETRGTWRALDKKNLRSKA